MAIAIFLTFILLVIATVASPSGLAALRQKPWQDWLLDGCGLAMQGLLIPLLQGTLVYWLYGFSLPKFHQCLQIPAIAGFLISFILVDYLYYWNHRLLHHPRLWALHQVHHTVTQMDVLGTSRNTLWTSGLILYLWIHPLFLHLLAEPTGYAAGVACTAMLDLWRHSRFTLPATHPFYHWLHPWLILPQDHARHHARHRIDCNYGANLKLWDRLHQTDCPPGESHPPLGISLELPLWKKLLYPKKSQGHC